MRAITPQFRWLTAAPFRSLLLLQFPLSFRIAPLHTSHPLLQLRWATAIPLDTGGFLILSDIDRRFGSPALFRIHPGYSAFCCVHQASTPGLSATAAARAFRAWPAPLPGQAQPGLAALAWPLPFQAFCWIPVFRFSPAPASGPTAPVHSLQFTGFRQVNNKFRHPAHPGTWPSPGSHHGIRHCWAGLLFLGIPPLASHHRHIRRHSIPVNASPAPLRIMIALAGAGPGFFHFRPSCSACWVGVRSASWQFLIYNITRLYFVGINLFQQLIIAGAGPASPFSPPGLGPARAWGLGLRAWPGPGFIGLGSASAPDRARPRLRPGIPFSTA